MSLSWGPEGIRYRIVIEHVATDWGLDDGTDYHAWYIPAEAFVKANKNGVSSPRMDSADWLRVACNNGDCPALAFVNLRDVIAAVVGGHLGVSS